MSTPTRDEHTTIADLRRIMSEFVDERDWSGFHTPKSLSMSLGIEAAELMEHFQWITDDQSVDLVQDRQSVDRIGTEVADCLSYLLSIANALDIDLTDCFERKMADNRRRYPIGSSGIRNR